MPASELNALEKNKEVKCLKGRIWGVKVRNKFLTSFLDLGE